VSHRVPQVILTLTPKGDIVAEFPGVNGGRRQVAVDSMSTIRTILAAQLRTPTQTVGMDGSPTAGQTRHWEAHLARNTHDPMCPWCIASEMGIDTSRSAHLRAKRALARARLASLTNHQGDGSVRIRVIPKKSKHISATRYSTEALFDED